MDFEEDILLIINVMPQNLMRVLSYQEAIFNPTK